MEIHTAVPQASAGSSRRAYTRQRQGCLTCRRRKKKCDRCYPLCGHCMRLNLACEREEPRRVVSPKPGSQTINVTPASALPGWSGPSQHHVATIHGSVDYVVLREETARVDMVASRRAILRYYTTVFATLLSTNQENNCFLSVMLPMAFECSTLMQSLVAWASSHLAARDPSFEHTALEHRGSALSALRASIGKESLSSEMCLAVTMVFCSMESISSTNGSWYQHLLGGATALGHPRAQQGYSESLNSRRGSNSTLQTRLSSIEGGWLVRNFAYHDALMSVTMDTRPLITGHYWATTDSDRADPYFGLASRIIYLVAQTSVLRADLADGVDSVPTQSPLDVWPAELGIMAHHQHLAQSHQAFFLEACLIENELIEWKCPEGFASTPLHLLAEAYRSAALLHLYRTLRLLGDNVASHVLREEIEKQVDAICELVREMPDGCLAECTLLFPLFMAGGEATSATHIEIIRNKMEDINRYRHFQNVDQALEVMNELWRLKSAGVSSTGHRDVDWLDITKSHGYKLAIS